MYRLISSASNPTVKETIKLRDGKHRRRTGRFLVDGLRETVRAAQAGIRFADVFLPEDRLEATETALRRAGALGPESVMYVVTPSVFEKLAFGNRREGPVAVGIAPVRTLEHLDQALADCRAPLLTVLEGVEKPGNVGAIFRSADGAALDGVILADPVTDLFNPNTIRGSLGTIFKMPSAAAETSRTLDWLGRHGIEAAVARCDGAVPYTEYDFRRPTAIVLGSEAEGLTDVWQGPGVTAVSLPMRGIADSLNVSVAAAILFYEARRQRGSSMSQETVK